MSLLKIQKTNEYAVIPTRGSAAAAGWDLYAAVPNIITIPPYSTAMIDTGLAMEIPEGNFGAIYPRSGLSTKQGLRLANCVAVIDSDYRGEIKVPLYNDSSVDRCVEPQQRIAQLVITPYLADIEFSETKELSDTERGSQGFGSSGKF